MGKVKEFTAKAHIGLLEAVILVFIILIWAAGFYEAYFLTKIQFLIYKETPGIFDWAANSFPIIIGSLMAMNLPTFIEHSKSKLSHNGMEISIIEMLLILLMLLIAIAMPYIMWEKCKYALDSALQLKLISVQQYTLRLSTIKWTISINLVVDFLLGLWSMYEVEKSNKKLRMVKLGRKPETTIPVTSSTSSTSSNSSVPVNTSNTSANNVSPNL